MKRLKRIGWIAGCLATAAVLTLFVRQVDLGPLHGYGPLFWARSIAALVSFQLFIVALHTLQWGLLLRQEGISIRVAQLYGARLAGAAISFLSPSLSVGGELVRAALVKGPAASTGRIAASVTIDKYVELAARMPFVATGLWILARRLPRLDPFFLEAGLAFALVVLTATALFAVLLRRGAGYRRRGVIARFLARMLSRLRPTIGDRVRRNMQGFARSLQLRRPAILLPLFAIGLLAAGAELAQIHLALRLVGVHGAGNAAAVQSASILGGIVGILPANAGAMEAANLLSITLLGGSAAAALTYSLLLRGGQAGIVICGLICLAVRRLRRTEAAAPPRQCCSSE